MDINIIAELRAIGLFTLQVSAMFIVVYAIIKGEFPKPSKILKKKEEKWPAITDKVTAYKKDPYQLFMLYMTNHVKEADWLDKIEWENYYREAIKQKPNITWQELVNNLLPGKFTTK